MELLGSLKGCVTALSASSVNDTSFASLRSDATVSLWDTRLKKRNYMSVPTARGGGRGGTALEDNYATEVLYAADRDLVVALCNNEIRFVDVRRQMDVLAVYSHTSEVIGFVAGKHPCGRRTTLVVDEEGYVMALDLQTMRPTTAVEEWVFGCNAPLTVGGGRGDDGPGFGQLSNLCCGLGLVDVEDGGEREEEGLGCRAVLAVGMDGKGQLYRNPSSAFPIEVSFDALAMDGTLQVVNPPFPACCCFHGNRVVVGKADGSYEMLEVSAGGAGLESVMAAPGHATNGLSCVLWADVGRGELLTASLCGQLTAWGVGAFLDEGEDGSDMPAVTAALDHRECVGSGTAVVNAGTELCAHRFLFCDNEGNVTLSRLE